MKMIKRGMDVLLAGFLLMLISLSVPKIFGFQSFAVTSGSMEPYLPTGSLIWIREEPIVQVGDVITFLLGETVVTHRVQQVLEETQQVVTKGDANQTRDAGPVSYEQILGTVQWAVPGLGYAGMALGTVRGRILAAFIFLWLLFMEVVMTDITDVKTAEARSRRGKRQRKECVEIAEYDREKNDDGGSGMCPVCLLGRGDGSVFDPLNRSVEEFDYTGKYSGGSNRA